MRKTNNESRIKYYDLISPRPRVRRNIKMYNNKPFRLMVWYWIELGRTGGQCEWKKKKKWYYYHRNTSVIVRYTIAENLD